MEPHTPARTRASAARQQRCHSGSRGLQAAAVVAGSHPAVDGAWAAGEPRHPVQASAGANQGCAVVAWVAAVATVAPVTAFTAAATAATSAPSTTAGS